MRVIFQPRGVVSAVFRDGRPDWSRNSLSNVTTRKIPGNETVIQSVADFYEITRKHEFHIVLGPLMRQLRE